jgi:gas vesicle protein
MKTSSLIWGLIIGVVAGAAAGAAIGILYAPDTGENTRRKLSQRGDELRGNIKNKMSDIGEDIRHKFEGAKSEAENLMEKGKSKAYEAKSDTTSGRV